MAIFVRRASSTPFVVVHDDAPVLALDEVVNRKGVREIVGESFLRDKELEPRIAAAKAREVAAPTAAANDAAASTGDKSSTPTHGATLAAAAIFALGVVIAVLLVGTDWGPGFKPAEGIGAFALFYIAAQAAERLVELVLPYADRRSGGKKEKEQARDTKVATARALTATPDQMKEAANAQAEVDQLRANRTLIAFGLTAAIGVVLCGYLEADFLTSVGVTFGDNPNNWTDAVRMGVTALVIGGGAKGLHDTIISISKSGEQKSTPKDTGGQA